MVYFLLYALLYAVTIVCDGADIHELALTIPVTEIYDNFRTWIISTTNNSRF